MGVAVPILLGLSGASFVMVTLPTFLRNILPQEEKRGGMNGLETATIGLGQSIGVEAGAYLEITDVYPPPEAEEGDWVFVPVYVRNKHTADVVAKLRATIDGITVESYPATLKAGADYSWGVHFTMPNKSVSGKVEAYYWVGDENWVLGDTASVSVTLKEPEEPEVPPEAPLSWRAIPAIITLGIVGGVLALIFIERREIERREIERKE